MAIDLDQVQQRYQQFKQTAYLKTKINPPTWVSFTGSKGVFAVSLNEPVQDNGQPYQLKGGGIEYGVVNSNVPPIFFYEVQLASNSAFTADVTTYSLGTSLTMAIPLSNVSRYARARARSINSDWSEYRPDPQAGAGTSTASGQINLDTDVVDGTTYNKTLASHVSSGVSYNFQGAWSSGTSYVIGDEISYNGTFWLAIADSTAQTPATGSSYWQQVGITVLAADDATGSATLVSAPVTGFYYVVSSLAITAISTGVLTYTLGWTQGGTAHTLTLASVNSGPGADSRSLPIYADSSTNITVTRGGTSTGVTGEAFHARVLGPF